MRRSDELQEVLSLLGEEHRKVGAPAGLESSLRNAVRANRRDGPWIRWRIPSVAAAAVLVLLLVRGREPGADPVVTAERVTEFVMLPASFALPAPAGTSILRVELRKGDLRQYGFDVPPPVESDMVRADFVVGEDGLARAVRLVQ